MPDDPPVCCRSSRPARYTKSQAQSKQQGPAGRTHDHLRRHKDCHLRPVQQWSDHWRAEQWRRNGHESQRWDKVPGVTSTCDTGINRGLRSTAGDDWHNLFITKQLSATLTVELILAELMEATVREMPHMVDREVLEVSNNKIDSLYEEPLASAQRKRWLNSIDFNPVGPFCAIACG
jgi:hypothetical protein